jgi:seryl-tRNA synthetase
MVAMLEVHQQEDGSINIPEVLHPYLPFTKID